MTRSALFDFGIAREGQYHFCRTCGEKCEPIGPKVTSYDSETGNPNHQIRYRCPRKRWWNFHTDQWCLPRTLPPEMPPPAPPRPPNRDGVSGLQRHEARALARLIDMAHKQARIGADEEFHQALSEVPDDMYRRLMAVGEPPGASRAPLPESR